jgi:two-component system, chemotaxis family, sensor kinase CheA
MAKDNAASRQRLETFRSVAAERFARVNLLWIQFEQGNAERATIDELLREIHTLKGEASLMGFAVAAAATHTLEDLVQWAVRLDRAPDSATGDLVLEGLDLVDDIIQGDPSAPHPQVADFEKRVRTMLEENAAEPALPGLRRPSEPFTEELAGEQPARSQADFSVRVTPAQLDRMRDIIGELLLSRVRLSNAAGALRSSINRGSAADLAVEQVGSVEDRLRDEVHRTGNLINALEDLARALRMVPIGQLLDQYPRAVRELGRSLGRDVRVEISGREIEADREVLEALQEPLLHLVRNAVDHGIEPPEERSRKGKPPTGRLNLTATVLGDSLTVELADDGAGIDVQKVREQAVKHGLLDAPSARVLSDEQVLRYLFASGFSTRDSVTHVSGRGLGLDVVQATVEALGGSTAIETERDVGTWFRITVPITVSITSLMLMRVGASQYALPAAAVLGIVDASELPVLDSIDGAAVRYNGEVVPLLPLDRMLNDVSTSRGNGADTEDGGGEDAARHNGSHRSPRLIIARSGSRMMALAGTHSHLEREAIIKPLGDGLKKNRLVQGGVTLEDGTLALVLSVTELLAATRSRATRLAAGSEVAPSLVREGAKVLVVEDSVIMRDIIAETLRSYGLDVIEAGDGAEALAVLEVQTDISLLVTDLEMPKVDGFELIHRIRGRETHRRLPAVVVSTRGSDADMRAALEVGADAYLVKSDFSREGLWSKIGRFLK